MKLLFSLISLLVFLLNDSRAQLFDKTIMVNNNNCALRDAIPRSNGNNLVSGIGIGTSQGVLIELTQNGDTVWVKEIKLENYYTNIDHLRELPNHKLVIAGTFNSGGGDNEGFVALLDSIGNIEIAAKVENDFTNSHLYINDLLIDEDANVYLCGLFRKYWSSGSYSSPFLTKLNPDLTAIWVRTYGSQSASNEYSGAVSKMTFDSSGNICTWGYHSQAQLTGATYLAKWSPDGNLIWSKQKNITNENQFNSIAIDPQDNIYVLYGVSPSPSSSEVNIALEKHDQNGNVLWTKNYGTTNEIERPNGMSLKDNLIYVVSSLEPTSGLHQILISVVDTSGVLLTSHLNGATYNGPRINAVHEHHFMVTSFTGNLIQFAENGIMPCTPVDYPMTTSDLDYAMNNGVSAFDSELLITPILSLPVVAYTREINTTCSAPSPCFASTHTISTSICASETYFFGGQDLNETGTYIDTLVSVTSCDSIVVLNLIVNNTTSGIDTQTACDSFTWIDGITYNASNNNATYTLSNMLGCDSLVTLNLVINNSTDATVNESACDSFAWALNGTTYTSSGTYEHIETNADGCLLTTTLNLTISEPTSFIDTQNACESFTWIDGNTYTESNNSATYLLTNAAGCDSLVTLNLNITQIDVTTTLSGETITATAAGASYQWINCNNNSPIAGQTNQSFTPTVSGSYAVIVSQNGCEETSDCVAVTIISVEEISANEIVLFPNPSNGIFQIQSLERIQNVRVYDSLGKKIDIEYLSGSNQINCGKVSSGNYIIELILGNTIVRKSLFIR